jgi:CheY-like chemotaxis protein
MKQLKKRVLFLDDNLDTIEALKLRLEARGYEVFTGMDGLEGLLKTKKLAPDLIILDIQMPRMDGVELFKTLRASKPYQEIPIMILTGRADLRKQLEHMGCDLFTTKPYQADEVAEQVTMLLKEQILIVGDDEDFQGHVKASFPGQRYDVKIVSTTEDMLTMVSKKRYGLVVARLAEIQKGPEELMIAVRSNSINSKLTVIVYCDAYVKGTETNDENAIVAEEVKWTKQKNVLFYDRRIKDAALSDFVEDRF